MTLLLISHTADLYGAERSLLDFAIGLQAQRVVFLVLCPAEGPLTHQLRTHHIPIVIFRLPRPQLDLRHLAQFIILWLPTLWHLWWFMKRNGITAVYNNTIDGLYAPFAARLARIPCLWHVREVKPKNLWGRKLFAWLLRCLPDRVVFSSNNTLLAYAERPFAHWQVVYNGIKLPAFPLRHTQDTVTVGFVGQLVALKRPERFLKAFALAQQSCPNLRSVIVGDGPLLEKMRQLADELGITPDVEIKGYLNSMLDLYASFDILVLTSDAESFGRVLVEAMASGCPVIASRVGGVPEVVENGQTGFLVDPDDIPAYAEKIIQLAQDTELRQCLGLAGRKRALTHFTVERYCEQLIRIIEEIRSLP